MTYFADEEGFHAEVNYQEGPHGAPQTVPRQSAPVVLVKKAQQPNNLLLSPSQAQQHGFPPSHPNTNPTRHQTQPHPGQENPFLEK